MKIKYFDNCLVGSGPAAISFMLARNHYSNHKDKLLWIEGGDFSDDQELTYKSNSLSSPKYDNIDFQKSNKKFINHYNINCQDISIVSCIRKGGNGAIWGSAISEFTEKEFGLPKINYNELLHAYKKVSDSFSFLNKHENYLNNQNPLKIVSNLKKLILKKSKKKQFIINFPRLAINLSNNKRHLYNYKTESIMNDDNLGIFNTKLEIQNFKNDNNVTFKDNHILEKFTFKDNIFEIEILDVLQNKRIIVKSKKITLAAGAIGTPILISRFLKQKISTRIQHNPAYFFAFLDFNLNFMNSQEEFVRLANAEYHINDKNFKQLFGQIYPSEILSNKILIEKFNFLKFVPSFLLQLIKKQVCLSTIYLEGRYSSTFMKINGKNVKIFSQNNKNANDKTKLLKKIVQKYFNFILPIGSTIIENGTDAHYGCTMPYSKKTKPLTSNEYGKIYGINKNLTVIDGSILKHLPAKPLTFTIMANAYRIGKNEYQR